MQVIQSTNEIKEYFAGRKTAVALGAFDGLHIGHRAVIRRAVESGFLPVVFTFRNDPMEVLGGPVRYLTTVEERLCILESWGVQAVVMIDFAEVVNWPAERFVEMLFQELRAQVLSCGNDFRFGRRAAGTVDTLREACASHGAVLHVTRSVLWQGETVSATRIRDALEKGDAKAAAAMLGRPFGFEFEVVHGNHLGRTIGIPTINQHFPERFVLPRFGVYATAVHVGGAVYGGVTNVGVKPTVGSDRALAETWILDFAGDLYGSTLRLELLEFIRDEQKFPNLEALRERILEDAAAARVCFESYRKTKNE